MKFDTSGWELTRSAKTNLTSANEPMGIGQIPGAMATAIAISSHLKQGRRTSLVRSVPTTTMGGDNPRLAVNNMGRS